mgnify:CR=1 FL=1
MTAGGPAALILLSALALTAWSGLVTIPVIMAQPTFLVLHSAIEIFATVVALLIFSSGYHTLTKGQPLGSIFLACAFVGVGFLDFLHALSYPGMTDFITPNTTHKGIVLWLAARFLAAIALLFYSIPAPWLPGWMTRPRPPRHFILAACLAYSLLWAYLGVYMPDRLPATYEVDRGLTPLKLILEWLVIFIHLATLALLFGQGRYLPTALRRYLAPALVLLVGSELFFTMYRYASDSFNLLGHVYKVLAYLLIYRAIFLENIKQPYVELEEAQQQISLLDYALDNVEEAAYLIDRHSRFHYVNLGACRALDYERPELLGMGVLDVDRDMDAATWHSHWQQVHRQGSLLFTSHHRTRQGRTFPVEISANYFEHQGRQYILAMVRDISERARMEEALARSHANLLVAQRIAKLGSWEWDIASGRLSWSDEAYRIFGVTPQQFTPTYDAFLELLPDKDRQALQEAVEQALQEDQDYAIEHRVIRADGSQAWVYEKGEVVRDDAGAAMRMHGTIQDISERKAMEARELQADKMAAMGLLASGIAHDFNNILTPIMMHTQLALQDMEPDNPVANRLLQVSKAADRAAALVRQILDFSHQGKHEAQPANFTPIIKEAIKFFKTSMPANITIKQEINTEHDGLLADPTQLLQVIMNLGINAMHAIGEQQGELTIRLEESKAPPDHRPDPQSPGTWLKLSVIDTGCGIAPDNIPRLFDPFFTTKEKGHGTGMGLSVVHGIITRHGGVIQVHSTPGKGTTIEVLLPGLSFDSEDMATEMNRPVGGNEHLLLVDDDPAVLRAEADTLTSLGYTVTTAPGGQEALAMVQAEPAAYDLLITDYNMPKLKGTDLALAVKELRSDLPIILCTGYTSKLDESAAMALGISALLLKPLRRNDFAATIRRILDNQELHQGNGAHGAHSHY